MTTLLFVSHAGLWLLTLFLLVAVFGLTRQVGLLHHRIGPSGARMLADGPEIGDDAPGLETVDLQGHPVTLAMARGRLSLLVFVAPGCSMCAELMPAVRALWRAERKHIDVMVLSLAKDPSKNPEFAATYALDPIPVVSGAAIAESYNVKMPPYGVLVGIDGKVKAKGLVNSLEHLESLVTAARIGHPTMESYMRASGSTSLPIPSAPLAADRQLSA